MPTVDAGLWALLAAAVSGIVTILVARFNFKQAFHAQQAEREADRDKVDAEAYRRARENYDAALQENEERITRLRRDIDHDRQDHERELAEFRESYRVLRREHSDCMSRVDDLLKKLTALRVYTVRLAEMLKGVGVTPPDPPDALGGNDPQVPFTD